MPQKYTLRTPLGADAVWYQEHIQQNGTSPNLAEVVARMYEEISLADVLAMPASEVWPLWRAAQSALDEGFAVDPTD